MSVLLACVYVLRVHGYECVSVMWVMGEVNSGSLQEQPKLLTEAELSRLLMKGDPKSLLQLF